MVYFILGCSLLLLITLLLIWLPFFKKQQLMPVFNHRQITNSAIYQYQVKNLAMTFKRDDAVFNLLKNELALGLLTEEVAAEPLRFNDQKTLAVPIILTLFVLLVTVVSYLQLGSYQQVSQYQHQLWHDPLIDLNDNTLQDSKLIELKNKIRANPADSQLWYILIQNYFNHNEFDDALAALAKVEAYNGETTDSLVTRATILYYQNQQQMNIDIQRLLDKVLVKEPLQITALSIISSDHYNNGRYQQAIDVWQRLLDSNNPEISRIMLMERINTAKMMFSHQRD